MALLKTPPRGVPAGCFLDSRQKRSKTLQTFRAARCATFGRFWQSDYRNLAVSREKASLLYTVGSKNG
jgi:hypothetical protein